MADEQDYERRLWDSLGTLRTGLLRVADGVGADHAQPMTAHLDGEESLYFFGPADARLARSVGAGGQASFYYTGADHALYAVLQGGVSIEEDAELRARLWSDEVERWFPGQRDDGSVALIRLALDEGEVWLPGGSGSIGRRDGRPADLRERVFF